MGTVEFLLCRCFFLWCKDNLSLLGMYSVYLFFALKGVEVYKIRAEDCSCVQNPFQLSQVSASCKPMNLVFAYTSCSVPEPDVFDFKVLKEITYPGCKSKNYDTISYTPWDKSKDWPPHSPSQRTLSPTLCLSQQNDPRHKPYVDVRTSPCGVGGWCYRWLTSRSAPWVFSHWQHPAPTECFMLKRELHSSLLTLTSHPPLWRESEFHDFSWLCVKELRYCCTLYTSLHLICGGCSIRMN